MRRSAFAGMQKLSRLIVLWDDNGISIDGKVSVVRQDRPDRALQGRPDGRPTPATATTRAKSTGPSCDAKASPLPALVACKTHIGYGAPTKQDSKAAHGSPLGGGRDRGKTREVYGWSHGALRDP
jgi:transketolase